MPKGSTTSVPEQLPANKDQGLATKPKQDNGPRENLSKEGLNRRFKNAHMVSLIRVNHVAELIRPSLSGSGLPRGPSYLRRIGMLAIEGYSYTASVLRVWKDEIHTIPAARNSLPTLSHKEGEGIKLRVSLSQCIHRFSRETEYVVFLTYKAGKMQVLNCEQMVAVKGQASWLSVLDNLQKGH